MIEGAIIGAVIGVVVSLVMVMQRGGTRKKVLAMFAQGGPEAALRLLDQRIPPVQKIALSKLIAQRERMAALGAFGDLARIEQEMAGHSGSLTAEVQVKAIGLLALAVRSQTPAEVVVRLEELATRMETEGGRTMALVKKKTRAIAGLAKGLCGERIPGATRLSIDSLTSDGGFVQLLIWQAMRRALTAAEQSEQAQIFAGKVLALTRAFEETAS